MSSTSVKVMPATQEHAVHADRICQLIYESALQRGTGIARRSPEYIIDKIQKGKAVVAMDGDRLVGFSYIESWEHDDYVATSGLIVDPAYRRLGLAGRIKESTFKLARQRFPKAKIFSITTSLPVMKLNTRLGYKPVTFSELTADETFWQGCKGCINYDVLQRNKSVRCICTGMLFDPADPTSGSSSRWPWLINLKNKIKNIFRVKR